MSEHRAVRLESTAETASVTPLELFFDLVFVFALTQVTAFMADHLTWHGLLRGMLIVGLLWWSWVGYSWLGNVVRADEGAARAVMFAAMAPMLVLALCIPEAFDDLPGGISGPVVLALCYFVFRILHLVMFWVIARDDPGLRNQLLRFTPSVLGATVILLIASQFTGWTQTALWVAALLFDYGGTMLGGASGWRLRSARHFAERHGLILIVALGESIVAIGVGIAQLPISVPIIVGAVLGLAVSAALWWLYFDLTSGVAEHRLATIDGADRARLGRDAYSFLHMALIAGVVLLALGLKKVLEYVGDSEHHQLSDALHGLGLYALFGGVVLSLLANIGFKLRATGRIATPRIVVVILLLALIPVANGVPAIAALGMLALVLAGLIVYETVHYSDERYRIRHSGH